MNKISVLCSDLSSHAAGRAWLLAEILKVSFEVEIIGPRFAESRWYPLQEYGPIFDVKIPVPSAFPVFVPKLLRAITGDVLYASKLRMTSFGLALLKRRRNGTPIALDIDDWEAAYILDKSKAKMISHIPLEFGHPDGFPYVLSLEILTKTADMISVASTKLRKKFGGDLLYHVRDTDVLNPGLYDRDACRAKIGLETSFNIMFLGNPARHKGLIDLAEAIASAGLSDTRLVVVGPTNNVVEELRRDHSVLLRLLPEQPIGRVGQLLAAADLVCLPQRPTRYGSFQTPAKVFDAMAMAKPIIVTAVSDLPTIVDGCGLVVPPLNREALSSAILRLYHDRSLGSNLGRAAREKCIREFSLQSARRHLIPLMFQLMEGRTEV